ncbi:zinc finger, C2H2 type [Ancylostoma ceylanicum]|uniref:Zinc finger, C2H2 type n=1 Tax=Ancylostoma ceylanicum TaxID=53326 RepID=A0A0D6LG83_9BILA|nr:zinc finger, C2H2 type [Ancylostoma ceylanicum]
MIGGEELSEKECGACKPAGSMKRQLISGELRSQLHMQPMEWVAYESIAFCSAVDKFACNIVENVMRHVENALSKEREKKTASNTPRQSESSENDRDRKDKDRRDRSPGRSTDHLDDHVASEDVRLLRNVHEVLALPAVELTMILSHFVLPEDECPFACRQCHRGFYTIKELAEHEIRAHDMKIPCAHCDKNAVSITKLAAHMLFRHPAMEVVCHYCDQKFGGPADKLDKPAWDDFRGHVYKEILKKKMYEHSSKASGASSDAVALRGVGRCPHGAAVKCKNFPNCPGAKCIYSHGQCRYDITCNKSTCPFDHSNRPRVCMACINDMKLTFKCEALKTNDDNLVLRGGDGEVVY